MVSFGRHPKDRMMTMNLTLVHGSMEHGGIETTLARLAKAAAERDWTVHALLTRRSGTDLEDRLLQHARISIVPCDYRFATNALKGLASSVLANTDVCFAPTGDGLLVTGMFQRIVAPRSRPVAGVYHPLEYGSPAVRKVFDERLALREMLRLPAANRIFMNRNVARSHASRVGLEFLDSRIVPVPMDVPPLTPGSPTVGRIVSIGRLVDFKPYPLAVLRILPGLLRDFPYLRYDIFGDGPLRVVIDRKISELGLVDHAATHGTIPYHRVASELETAHVFVGMGLSLVEAAARGVPSIAAVVSERQPLSYGFFHEHSGADVGERLDAAPTRSMASDLREALSWEATEFELVRRASRARALSFSAPAVLPRLLDILDEARPHHVHVTRRDVTRGLASLARSRFTPFGPRGDFRKGRADWIGH